MAGTLQCKENDNGFEMHTANLVQNAPTINQCNRDEKSHNNTIFGENVHGEVKLTGYELGVSAIRVVLSQG